MEVTKVDISKIDKNFAQNININDDSLIFLKADSKPFKMYGLIRDEENNRYARFPMSVAEKVSEGVANLSTMMTGGRIRFRTDSRKIAISCKIDKNFFPPHLTLTMTAGMDLYLSEGDKPHFVKTYVPTMDLSKGYDGVFDFGSNKMRMLTLNLPLYAHLSELYIGLEKGSQILEPIPYKYETPIVFYGSSITQGAASSRPGMSFPHQLSRALDSNFNNFGFAGRACGESEMAEYLSHLDMSAFVMDYDYNAPTVEHLAATHKPFFDIIRKANPTLPIIMMSRPKSVRTAEDLKRRDIVKNTYDTAVEQGDKNVYFIDGGTYFPEELKDDATADHTHPTDLGFTYMVKKLEPILKSVLENK